MSRLADPNKKTWHIILMKVANILVNHLSFRKKISHRQHVSGTPTNYRRRQVKKVGGSATRLAHNAISVQTTVMHLDRHTHTTV